MRPLLFLGFLAASMSCSTFLEKKDPDPPITIVFAGCPRADSGAP